jgi:succinate dehydrogenase/fumarate reductase cytochrome b subunit
VTGSRKYRFAILALFALVAGFGFAASRDAFPAPMFEQYVYGLVLLVTAFGGTNGIEHLATALRGRKAKPKVSP